jgi:hypothetical protein
MSVLTAIQNACAVIPLTRPEAVFSSTEREHFELQVLASTAAGHIARDYEWQKLKAIATIAGDGAAADFGFPADYDRMLKQAELRTGRHRMALLHIVSSDQWLDMTIRESRPALGAWTIYGNRLHLMPAPADGEVIRYFYMSARWAVDTNGTPKADFSADTDMFRLSEKLLELAMIWKWRAGKGLGYAEDLANYEDAKEKLITADKGARILTVGSARRAGAHPACPEMITP